jgi:hypothetical protein
MASSKHRQGTGRRVKSARHVGRARTARRWSLGSKVLSATVGVLLVGTASYAATNWLVGLNSGSKALSQAASVSNVTITAATSPAPSNLLYPGGTGDVVATVTNPNKFPVTITGVNLPTNTTYAAGYSDSGLTTAVTTCDATASTVAWAFASSTSGTPHTLTSALVVGANTSLTVTFTSDAVMGTGAPSACQNNFFSMPSLTGIAASGGSGTPTTSPATDSWTS